MSPTSCHLRVICKRLTYLLTTNKRDSLNLKKRSSSIVNNNIGVVDRFTAYIPVISCKTTQVGSSVKVGTREGCETGPTLI